MNLETLMLGFGCILFWIVGAGTTVTGLLNANRKLIIYGLLILLLDLVNIFLVLYMLGVFA